MALAVLAAIKLCSTSRYSRFLVQRNPGDLDAPWFKAFVADWAVARTIRSGCLDEVRTYLDVEFRAALKSGDPGEAVDRAAEHLQRKGWSLQNRKDGGARLPISLVSKIGFLLDPDRIVPFDSFAREGLKRLQGRERNGGQGTVQGKKYTRYLATFEASYVEFRQIIDEESTRSWVRSLAQRIGFESDWLVSPRFRRKVFDNFLMQLGGRAGLSD